MRLKNYLLCLLLAVNALTSFAGNWERKYLADEFGDPDYSKPVYVITCIDPRDQWIQIEITYTGSAFVLRPDYSGEYVTDASTIKAKGSNGKIYQFHFKKPDSNSYLYGISDPSDVNIMMNLLEQGNFTLSLYRPENRFQSSFNYNFKIGTQGQGIKRIAGVKSASTGKVTFKGKIGGKYSITVVFDQPESIFENGGNLTGTYWYGTGKNGKMKLKGTADYLGRIEMEEYDPQGKKCGDWYLNTLSSDDGMKYALDGVLMNANNQTFNVSLTQQ